MSVEGRISRGIPKHWRNESLETKQFWQKQMWSPALRKEGSCTSAWAGNCAAVSQPCRQLPLLCAADCWLSQKFSTRLGWSSISSKVQLGRRLGTEEKQRNLTANGKQIIWVFSFWRRWQEPVMQVPLRESENVWSSFTLPVVRCLECDFRTSYLSQLTLWSMEV